MESVASWHGFGAPVFLHDDDRHVAVGAPEVVERIGVAPMPEASPVERIAWMVGFLASVLDEAARAVGAEVVDHETLCLDPVGEFRRLSVGLGLGWRDAAEELLVSSNREGFGESLQRVAAELPGRWRERFEPTERAKALAVLTRFPIATRWPDLHELG